MEYAVVIEPTSTGFSAYVPDVTGCVAAGETEAEVTAQMREALEFHFEAIRADGEPIPQPASRLDYIEDVQSASGSSSNGAHGTCGYAIVIERGPTSYGAYVPDLPGCIAVAQTEAEVRKLIREGVDIHLEQMRLSGEPIPAPTSRIAYVDVAETASVA
ncbi:MAG TPA: type II toxin-antitoxin system HicB family antitoxin [Longimicrobium sp.]|nr:type II toxin-antitoxin system HicB family antitoxin [Longimicrobium sp.]